MVLQVMQANTRIWRRKGLSLRFLDCRHDELTVDVVRVEFDLVAGLDRCEHGRVLDAIYHCHPGMSQPQNFGSARSTCTGILCCRTLPRPRPTLKRRHIMAINSRTSLRLPRALR